MAKTFRAGFSIRFFNALITFSLRTGVLAPKQMSLLTVRGRKSGELRTNPVALTKDGQGRTILMAPYGAVNWVRNLRAAGGEATLTRGRNKQPIRAVELKGQDAVGVLKQILGMNIPKFLLDYFEARADSPWEELEQEARRHPIFHILTQEEFERESLLHPEPGHAGI
jgi:deazaflavin-dependent oxidoreductase (nitroreductase family)